MSRLTRRTLLAHFRQADSHLADLIEQAGPYRLHPVPLESPFKHLASAIIAQQISGRAAETITQRLVLACCAKDFPTPQQLIAAPIERLRAAGVSRAKLTALIDLSERTLQGQVPDSHTLAAWSDAEIIERLTIIRGVGPWTVQMMLMFQLGRPDVMASSDYGVRKGFKLWYRKRELPTPAALERYGHRWAPYRSAACWYLWRALELKTTDSDLK